MKIPGFAQNIGEFFSNKTNWSGLVMVGLSAVGFYAKVLSVNEATVGIVNGMAILFVRDAIAKIEVK